jgi:hypothetical protein
LAGRLSRRVQLTSDALGTYPEAVERGFGNEVDYTDEHGKVELPRYQEHQGSVTYGKSRNLESRKQKIEIKKTVVTVLADG